MAEEDVRLKISLKKLLFSFRGRIDIAKFWGLTILLWILVFILVFVEYLIYGDQAVDAAYVVGLFFIFWPKLALLVKRCHDRDHSGAFVLISLIPLINLWFLIEIFFVPGPKEPNSYGASTFNRRISL